MINSHLQVLVIFYLLGQYFKINLIVGHLTIDCSQSPIFSWDCLDIARLTDNGGHLDFQMYWEGGRRGLVLTVSPQSQWLQGKIEDCEQSNLTRAYINTEFNYQGISVISISDSDKLGIDSLICIGKLACLWTESYSLKEICVWQIISSQRFEAAEE